MQRPPATCLLSLQQPGGEAVIALLADCCLFLLRQAQRTALPAAHIAARMVEALAAALSPRAVQHLHLQQPQQRGSFLPPRQLALCVEAAGVATGVAMAKGSGSRDAMLKYVDVLLAELTWRLEALGEAPSRASPPAVHVDPGAALGTA